MAAVPRGWVIATASPVVMTNLGAAFATACPIFTGMIFARLKGCSVPVRAGQNVMLIGSVSASVDHLTFFGELRFFGKIILAVQLSHIGGNLDLALNQGPEPIRSLAFTAGCPPAACALR